MDYINNLEIWRQKRNIVKPNTRVFVANIVEELLEVIYTDKEQIKSCQKSIMKEFFPEELFKNIPEHRIVDSICDIKVFGCNELENMDYCTKIAMNETVKEVSSREQDPTQKQDWDLNGPNGKWQKNLNQNPTTLYTADFNKAKKSNDIFISNILDGMPDPFKCYKKI